MNIFRALTTSLSLIGYIFICGCGNGVDGGADIRYVALGASETTGVGASPIGNSYVHRIKNGIEDQGKSVNQLNYGIPDIEIGGLRDVELRALDLGPKPDIVTLFVGGNDLIAGTTTDDFEGNLDAVLNHISKISGVDVFVADLPDLTKLPRFVENPDPDVTEARVRAYNVIIANICARYGAVLVHISAAPDDPALISDDGLHPNNAGYQTITGDFLNEMLPVIYAAS